MSTALTLERVRRDAEVIARAGLDTATFLEEFQCSVHRAVPHVAACFATLDPATRLLTSTYKFGDLYGNDSKDDEWAQFEYGAPEPTSFIDLIESPVPSVSMRLETGQLPASAVRMREFIMPTYGYTDELRVAARERGVAWGGMALFRSGDDEPFSRSDVAFLAQLSGDFAVGLRSGLLVRLAGTADDRANGPVVVIVGPDGRPRQLSVGAEEALRAMSHENNQASSLGTISALVAGARRYAAGSTSTLPRARVRLSSGQWLLLHASPLSGAGERGGDVVVTIEEARPPEIVPLIVAAFDLTARERDVTQLVLQGVETKQIAESLHMSRYTVQDHLKSVFTKADVRSRRELIARVYFDQYLPRMGAELAPSGWYETRPDALEPVAVDAVAAAGRPGAASAAAATAGATLAACDTPATSSTT